MNEQNSRVLIAVVLATLTLFLWYSFFSPDPPPKKTITEPATNEVAAQTEDRTKNLSNEPVEDTVLPDEEQFILESSNFTATISSHGAQIIGWKVHDLQYAKKDGTPLNMIPETPEELPRAWIGEVSFEKASFPLPAKMAFSKLLDKSNETTLYLRWENKEKTIILDKIFRIEDQGLSLQIALQNTSAKSETAKLSITINGYQDPDKTEGEGFFLFRTPPDIAKPSCYINEETQELELGETSSESFSGELSWAGINRTYFVSALYPKELLSEEALSCSLFIQKNGFEKTVITYPEETISEGKTIQYTLGIYLGPKKSETLSTLGNNLGESVDYGWLSPISKGMLYLLKFFYGLVGNWGIAIILLTLVLRLLMFYPSQKSFKSMQGMATLRPQIEALKEKHKGDQQRFAQEQMALFKAHGVSPFGGCLPLLLQMPFFFALYRMLYQAVELYQADFGLWIHDLSAPDPYYIFPILFGVTMIVQQQFTPTTMGNAAQARLLKWLMPIMMSGFFLFLPSGLVLYSMTSVLFGNVQQYIIRRNAPKPEVVEPKPTNPTPSKNRNRRKKRR